MNNIADNFNIEEIESELKKSPIIGKSSLFGGANLAFRLELQTGSYGVFKPSAGEVELSRWIPRGSYFKREVAAYLLDKALAFGLVPPTVIREIEGEIGSIQLLVKGEPAVVAPLEWLDKINPGRKRLLAILDILLGAEDRHDGNWLVDETGGIYAIDNGLSFPRSSDYFYSAVTAEEIGAPISDEILEGISRLTRKSLDDLFKELLTKNELNETYDRIQNLINRRRILPPHRQIRY